MKNLIQTKWREFGVKYSFDVDIIDWIQSELTFEPFSSWSEEDKERETDLHILTNLKDILEDMGIFDDFATFVRED